MKKYFILLAMLLITLPCYSAIKVSPTIIELDANKARGNYLTASFDIQGGGVRVGPNGTFRMLDGEITGNSMTGNRGNVVVFGGIAVLAVGAIALSLKKRGK